MDSLSEQAGALHLSTLLLDLACRSAMLRISIRLAGYSTTSTADLRDGIRAEMCRLGRTLKNSGTDARGSAYWALLECREDYEEAFERNRRVAVAVLTPMAIFSSLSKGNCLLWNGWEIFVGGSREVTDDYACPAWESRVWIQPPSGELTMLSGISREQARKVYGHVTGTSFTGVDTLGHDDPHPAERVSLDDIVAYESAHGRGLIASSRDDQYWQTFEELAVSDPSACLLLFDACGRYHDPETGFWVSLRGEYLNINTGVWSGENAQSSVDEFMAEHGVAVYRTGDIYRSEEDRATIPVSELDKWFISLWSDSPYAKEFGELPLAETEAEAMQLAANLSKEVLAREAKLPISN